MNIALLIIFVSPAFSTNFPTNYEGSAVQTSTRSVVTAYQAGPWNVGLNAGSNQIGTVSGSTVSAVQNGSWTVNQGSSNTIFNAWPIVSVPLLRYLSQNGQMFVVSSTPTLPTANIETPVLLLVNLSTNTKTVSLRDIAISAQGKSNTAWHLYLSPVVTSSGTAISPTNSNLGSSNVAQLQTWLLPSVSSFGKLFRTFVSGVNNSFIFTFNFSVIIPPGNSILFTGTPPSNNVSVGIDVSWSEEVF